MTAAPCCNDLGGAGRGQGYFVVPLRTSSGFMKDNAKPQQQGPIFDRPLA